MRPDRAIVKKAILDGQGNLTRAAAILGCSRPTLYTWIYQHGLERVAGICQDRRDELDKRERKDGRNAKEIIPAVKSGSPGLPTLSLVPQQAAIEMPVNATVRLPESLWKKVRKTAIDRDCTVSQFVEAALKVALDQVEAIGRHKTRERGEGGE